MKLSNEGQRLINGAKGLNEYNSWEIFSEVNHVNDLQEEDVEKVKKCFFNLIEIEQESIKLAELQRKKDFYLFREGLQKIIKK